LFEAVLPCAMNSQMTRLKAISSDEHQGTGHDGVMRALDRAAQP
jgi:hypothetical protein